MNYFAIIIDTILEVKTMITDNDKQKQQNNNPDFSATLYSDNGENVVKKTGVNVEIDKSNPTSRKIIIEKQVNVVHKEAVNLKKCQLDLLDQVYRTAIMAVQSIEATMKDISSQDLKQEIDRQLTAYKAIYTKAVDYMLEQGLEPEKTNPITKALRWSGIKINSMTNRSDTHISEMMINGTTMGVISIHKAINHCTCDSKTEPKPLANEMLSLLRSSIDRLVKFL